MSDVVPDFVEVGTAGMRGHDVVAPQRVAGQDVIKPCCLRDLLHEIIDTEAGHPVRLAATPFAQEKWTVTSPKQVRAIARNPSRSAGRSCAVAGREGEASYAVADRAR